MSTMVFAAEDSQYNDEMDSLNSCLKQGGQNGALFSCSLSDWEFIQSKLFIQMVKTKTKGNCLILIRITG